MAGTWSTARAAIKSQLNGVTFDLGADYAAETLKALEFPPGGRQDATNWPYCFVMPSEQRVTREPGGQRITSVDAVVRVMLAPLAGSSDANLLVQRYDGWVEALKDALDDAVALDGTSDIFLAQVFGGLERYEDIDAGWGFEMRLEGIQISETKTFGP